MGWNSSHQPRSDKLCDWDACNLSSEVQGDILSCGHGYHMECFIQINQKCPYCYEYLHDGIKYNCKVFRDMLNKAFDDDNAEEDGENLENQEDSEENNVDET